MSKVSASAPRASHDRPAVAPGGRQEPRPAPKPKRPARPPKAPPLSSLGRDADPTAQRRAAAILEVLAGEQTAAEAARLLGISVMHYYLLERRALQGLVTACAPRPKGPPGPSPAQELTRVRRELERSRRECLRQAALVRATQRALGFPVAAGTPSKGQPEPASGKRARRRRTTIRALRAAQTLRRNSSGLPQPDVVERSPTEGNDGPPDADRRTPLTASARDAGLPTSPPVSDRVRTVTQEAAHGTQRQEAGGDGTCGASVGIGVSQAAAGDDSGDAPG